MTFDEIEERVKLSLEALNGTEELYDWRLTHYNTLTWTNLQEGCFSLSENVITEEDLKELIKAFRDRSQTSHIDFHIKVPEPGVAEFKRMVALFGLLPGPRLLPPRDADVRKAYVGEKIISAMRLTMEHKQIVSEKLRQQFTYLIIRSKEKSAKLLATHLKFEEYNPYQKRLASAPAVVLRNHFMPIAEDPISPTPAPEKKEPMFAPMVTDNSSFESRLPQSPAGRFSGKKTTVRVNRGPLLDAVIYPVEPEIDFPHELPAEIHEEFAAYCQGLFERRVSK